MRYILLPAIIALLTACSGQQRGNAPAPTAPAPAGSVAASPPPSAVTTAAVPVQPDPTRGGMALGPALVLVQGAEPGRTQDDGVSYHVENRGNAPLQMSLAVLTPDRAGTPTWELGYEPIPDPSWFTITPGTLVVPPGGSREAVLHWTVPADPAYANRRFALCVVLRPGSAPGVGAGLALAARVQFETTSDPSADAGAMAALATIPSVVVVDLAPGAATDCTVLVRRTGATSESELAWTGLEQAEVEAERRPRYATPGTIQAAIATPAQGSLPSHGGDWVALKLRLQAPADAVPGTRLEQILVVGTPDQLAIASHNPRNAQPQVALIRCQVRVVAKVGN